MSIRGKNIRDLRKFAEKHGDSYQYIAITHGTEKDTDDSIKKVGGDENMKVTSDPDREIYGQWVNPREDEVDFWDLESQDGYIGWDGVVYLLHGLWRKKREL